ncbi:MAG: aminoglycoside phosphotransferase family protein [Chromatiaceae bacterium]|nr:aminoglycoside phosphotransferase family protein [Chromatiaceae bacterium]
MDIDYIAALAADRVFRGTSYKLQRFGKIRTPSSLVFRLEFETSGRTQVLYVKIPAEDNPNPARFVQRLRREFLLAGRISSAFQSNPELRTVSPAGFIEEINGLLTWELKGESLQDVICHKLRFNYSRRNPELGRFAALAGRWLREFHALDMADSSPDLGRDILDYYAGRLEVLVRNRHSAITQAFADALMQKISDWFEQARKENKAKLVLCHNDFSPHNIIVTDAGISVLDFSFSTPGLPAFDLACFWHKIDDLKRSPIRGKRGLEYLQQRFLDAYGSDFDFNKPDVKLGLARLVLSKMLTLLNSENRGIKQRLDKRGRYSAYLRLMESDFVPETK